MMKILARIGIGILLILLLGTMTVAADYKQEILDAHNKYRAEVGSPPLTYSDSLAAGAQEWADYLGSTSKFDHSGTSGENMAAGSLTWTQAIDMWGSEKSNFKYMPFGDAASNTGSWKDIGHYTQVVWYNTQQVGCGQAPHNQWGTVFVCRYSPSGNYLEQYAYPISTAKIYPPWSFGSILIDPIGNTQYCDPDVQVSAIPSCLDGYNYPIVHLTWPAYSTTKPISSYKFWLKLRSNSVHPSWTLVKTDPDVITSDKTSLYFEFFKGFDPIDIIPIRYYSDDGTVCQGKSARITSLTCPSPRSIGDSITVTSPNGGESWQQGTPHTVTWDYSGSLGSKINIYLLKDKSLYDDIATNILIGNGGKGEYVWQIPSDLVPGTDYDVGIEIPCKPPIIDTSDNHFTISTVTPTITVTSPNGGETWQQGSSQSIQWSYTGNVGTTVRIELLKEGLVSPAISSSTPVGTSGLGSFTWTIRPNQATATDYKVRITSIANSLFSDISDARFTITTTSPTPSTKIGVYQNGAWYLDNDGSGTWNAGDRANGFGAPGWTPVVGDWNATGKSYIGITNGQQWYLDWNGNGAWDAGTDKAYSFGAPGWTNVTGDWNHDGKTEIGVTNGQQWYLDTNGNGAWDTGIDKAYSFGATGWTPVVGDWNPAVAGTKIGVYKDGVWYLDWNGNGAWDASIDKTYSFGAPGWTPLIGDWNTTANSYIGVTNGQQWYLDWNGNGAWDQGTDKAYSFGAPGWIPIIGDWNPVVPGTKIGVYQNGMWYLDNDGSGTWNAGDRANNFGAAGWIPIVGKWS